MITPISTLKRRFANFLKPTQEHFWAWMDSYWHKDENIPMNKVEGLSTALEGTASAEQLRNHLTDSQAHSGLFDHKVDKEAGKTLTSNDYTNEEKRTNQVNAQKRVVGLTVTGDVNKIITITFADGTAIQAPFTDNDTLPENLADIKLNSLNFNDQTGVLTGVRSDGQQLTVSLDGRYALLGHTHPEYALRTHRHHWDNIDGKPSMDFIPTSWNRRNNKEVIRTQVDEWLRINDFNSHSNGVFFGQSVIRTDGQLQIGEEGKNLLLTEDGSILIKDKTQIHIRDNGDIAFGNKPFNNLVNGEFAGIKIWGNADNNNVVLAGGGVATISSIQSWVGGYISSDWGATANWQNSVIFVMNSLNIELNQIQNAGNMSFRKVFAGGQVTFTCTGKTIIYTGDNAFNGGDGSTAVASIFENKCYIDIRNI